MEIDKQEGPSSITFRYCKGCIHLETEDWKFYGENDDVDSGTDAKCLKMNRHISSYWYTGSYIPDWCPYGT